MANVAMTDAIFEGIASSAEYNKVTANIRDLDARLGAVTAANTAQSRLTALEALTGGVNGNTALDGRLDIVEPLVNNASWGNLALDTRVDALEAAAGLFLAPHCRVIATTSQSIANGTPVKVAFDLTVEQRGVTFSNANDEITVGAGAAGIYNLSGGVTLPNNATGYRYVRWLLNGALFDGCESQGTMTTASNMTLQARTEPIRLVVGDKITLWIGQQSGGALSTQAGTELRAHMSLTWMAA